MLTRSYTEKMGERWADKWTKAATERWEDRRTVESNVQSVLDGREALGKKAGDISRGSSTIYTAATAIPDYLGLTNPPWVTIAEWSRPVTEDGHFSIALEAQSLDSILLYARAVAKIEWGTGGTQHVVFVEIPVAASLPTLMFEGRQGVVFSLPATWVRISVRSETPQLNHRLRIGATIGREPFSNIHPPSWSGGPMVAAVPTPAILPILPAGTRNEIVPPFADSVVILRTPSNSITVLQETSAGIAVDEVIVPAGEKCPALDLHPSTTVVRFINSGGVNIVNAAILYFLTF